MHNTEEKQGYKFTEEFGYIPEDWDVVNLRECCDNYIGLTYSPNNVSSDGTLVLRSSNIQEGCLVFNDNVYVTMDIPERAIAQKGDILVCVRNGSRQLIGKSAKINQNGMAFGAFMTILRANNFCSDYLLYLWQSGYVQKQIKESLGATINQITNADIQRYKVPIPSLLPEQEKIAKVLSDIDELIESTQKLIDKKKDLKTATMQKLLTPKPHWVTKKLGELVNYKNGMSHEDKISETGDYNLITLDSITIDGKLKKTHKKLKESNTFLKKGDLVMILSDVAHGNFLGLTDVIPKNNKYVLNQRVGALTDIKDIYPKFLRLIINSNQTYFKQNGQGSSQLNLNRDDILKFNVIFPINKKEQEDIVSFYYNMDAEIEALEKELNKYKDLKTGMMQELLTGKIRLKQENNNTVSIKSNKSKHKANDEFKDAVIISMLAYKFGSNEYPLGAFRRQKLSYLFKRYNNLSTDDYLKKAMGPYNPQMKYSGGEGIALRNKYVKKGKQGGLVTGDKIETAEEYYNRYFSSESLTRLVHNFKFETTEKLEVLATVDYAIISLKKQGEDITLINIKKYIESDKEWKPKLQKEYFSDDAIIKAMNKSKTLFNSY